MDNCLYCANAILLWITISVNASEIPPPANEKRTLAKYVHGLITWLGLQNVTLVGHDVES